MIALSRNCLGPLEEQAALQVIRSGQLVQGPHVARFEEEIRARLGIEHAIACSSGTAALHLVLWALEIASGDAGLYSTCRTCEIGMSRAVGRPYRSLVHLVQEALAGA